MLQRPEHVALRRPSLQTLTRVVRRRYQVGRGGGDLTTAAYGTTFASDGRRRVQAISGCGVFTQLRKGQDRRVLLDANDDRQWPVLTAS